MAQQQQQQPVAFLKPATWGSLKFAQTLKEKLFSGKGANEVARVGKENEYVPNAAPPKVDLSHLQTLGPRRHVAQRYALQPNLNVSRQNSAPQPSNPGLRGLVAPGAQAPPQHDFYVQPLQIPQQQAAQQQRPSTPSSPTMRGRAPLGQSSNPNFVNSNIATRLPTPVRINSVPSPSAPSRSSDLAMALPKPPSPSRSLSQGGMGGSPFAGAAVSPATSTATSTGFSIPVPPPVVPGAARGPQQPPHRAAQPWATSSGGAPAAARAHSSTATSRPSAAPGPERSILASLQPRNASILTPTGAQHQQHASTVSGATPAGVSGAPDGPQQQPQKKAVVAMPAPPPPLVSVSSAITVPALQQALQQALAAAVERKPETFKVDNFQQLFDSMMHPGHTGKLDGPLPDELADDVKYSDNWYKHCRDWNAKNKPAEVYTVAPPAAAPAPAEQAVPETPKSGLRSQWSLDEPPMSEACCRALDIAHHGLKKVLTPAHSSRSVSQAVGTPSVSRAAASSILAQRLEQLDDTAASRPAAPAAGRPDATPTSSAIHRAADALASPALDAAASPSQRGQVAVASPPPVASAAGSTNASPVSAALAARALAASASAMALGTAICSTPDRTASAFAAAVAAVGIRTAAVMALVDGHETPVVPTAAKASIRDLLSPTPTRGGAGGPPSNVTTPGGPLTPGGACSTAAPSAAATPAQAGASSTAATPTTDGRRAQSASPEPRETSELSAVEALLAAAASCSEGLERSLVAAVGGQQEAELATAPPEASMAAAAPAPTPIAADAAPELPTLAPVQAPQPVAAQEAVWSPNFPPVEASASTSAASAAAAGPARQYVPSPVTLMQNAPRELPTPNPAFFNSLHSAPSGAGNLAAAVAVVAAAQHAASVVGVQMRDPAGPSTSTAPPAADPLNEITTGIQQLTALKRTILAEDKAVDVTGITQVLQLKMAVEQLLARTSTAAAAASVASQAPAAPAAAAPVPAMHDAHQQQQQQQAGTPQRKLSRSASFSAFIKGIFSPKSANNAAAQPAAVPASPSASRAFGTSNAVNVAAAAPASPALHMPGSGAVGVQVARPASASALPRHVASPSVADRGRYAVLHQRAAARLAQAAAEPVPAAANPQSQQRGDVWRRYEEKIATHRQQLDTTKSQLDDAVRKLHDMQAEFDELLLCLGMESAKNRALCNAMRAAGIDPEPIMAAIESEWLAGNGEQ
ncbi:hypothetical protein HXX76_009592 [Chlamydomonas incerta]|uniref:Uncharacterized protein n=1 Tax=Chlamydomonas incerta TaxID=51695 RepID=A0A835VZF8_CHLIN|nr:hypothetical protein HXX76_009592 [Chlamydomonas incerta]|eukprot:KAG2431578.1 hypothetical protein HXX76_009592 [Chlamydomonas incerta]